MENPSNRLGLTKISEILDMFDAAHPLFCKENPYISTQRYS